MQSGRSLAEATRRLDHWDSQARGMNVRRKRCQRRYQRRYSAKRTSPARPSLCNCQFVGSRGTAWRGHST